jgi:hypothetical protein
VLNRFSKDTGHMDDNLPVTFFDFIQVSVNYIKVIQLGVRNLFFDYIKVDFLISVYEIKGLPLYQFKFQ